MVFCPQLTGKACPVGGADVEDAFLRRKWESRIWHVTGEDLKLWSLRLIQLVHSKLPPFNHNAVLLLEAVVLASPQSHAPVRCDLQCFLIRRHRSYRRMRTALNLTRISRWCCHSKRGQGNQSEHDEVYHHCLSDEIKSAGFS